MQKNNLANDLDARKQDCNCNSNLYCKETLLNYVNFQ